MLVLRRKPNERVIIGDAISVMVIKVVGEKVSLGFDAPEGVPIHREEVADKIRGENGTKLLDNSGP